MSNPCAARRISVIAAIVVVIHTSVLAKFNIDLLTVTNCQSVSCVMCLKPMSASEKSNYKFPIPSFTHFRNTVPRFHSFSHFALLLFSLHSYSINAGGSAMSLFLVQPPYPIRSRPHYHTVSQSMISHLDHTPQILSLLRA